ncbi:MAG: tetratricopeptide repeat protein [Pseudomonadota bacterium]
MTELTERAGCKSRRRARGAILGAVSLSIFLAPAAALAQLSVTTIGATEARACYENAANALSTDTGPCDTALRNRATTRDDRLKTLVNRGVILNRAENMDAALDDFNAALAMDGDSAEAYLNRGNAWFRLLRYEDALTDYQSALDYEISKPWVAWYNIGLVFEATKKPEAARDAFERAAALNPDFALAAAKLAR